MVNELIKIEKAGKELLVHADALAEHLGLGWSRVEADVKAEVEAIAQAVKPMKAAKAAALASATAQA